jgi:hypothetical protein
MALENPRIGAETKAFLDQADSAFTWIFIVEMFMKLIGIGIYKYVASPMNWLDGGVVCLSLFELLYTAINGSSGGGNLSSLKVLRTLRTVRILRIVRLLRSMKSMQVIFYVLFNSMSSMAYITILMFLLVFIFALIGLSLFGIEMGPTGKNDLPKMNFKRIDYAIATAF